MHHCPYCYCYGYEVADRRLGVLYASPMSLHQAALITNWGPTTLFLDGDELPPEDVAALAGRAVAIEQDPVAALAGEETALSAVSLESGRSVPSMRRRASTPPGTRHARHTAWRGRWHNSVW